MSHPLWYTISMKTIKNMKENTNKANNLIIGAIYINANTGQPARLVNIVPCQGVWLEAYDGQGYGDLVQFNDCHYADADEVQDFLADYRTYTDPTSVRLDPSMSFVSNVKFAPTIDDDVVRDSDGSAVVGWYDDNDGNDIRCRD